MSAEYHIVNTPLPANENFSLLKEEGVAFIQSHMNENWTNLNASDPGITILDQVCYALTELGYCTNFPIEDILADHNGKIVLHNQFYLPGQLLTTAPVTIDDYRIFLIASVPAIKNVIIQCLPGNVQVYKIWLYVDPATAVTSYNDIVRTAFYYLNRSRNLNQLFLIPVVLKQRVFKLTADIDIADKSAAGKILTEMQADIAAYIFPAITPENFPSAVVADINTVINGPELNNGWIDASTLGSKRNSISAVDVMHLIRSIPGVLSVSNVSFSDASGTYTNLTSDDDTILVIDVANSFAGVNGASSSLQFKATNAIVSPVFVAQNTSSLQKEVSRPVMKAGPGIYSADPKGKFRDINSYYSIQNTFPGIFKVGKGAVSHDTPDFQVAQSRQLKGYLTLFDQYLANQFSQLANIDKLFSFKNATTGTPSDRYDYYTKQDETQRNNPEYPVPFKIFSPTYYYQSLYEVPDIKPLLHGNRTFEFDVDPEPEIIQQTKSWEEYKRDPYNAYIKGLMELMYDEKTTLVRRNEILDHLLARHGESPLTFDFIISGSVYTGDPAKDKVIFKSLYLQHLSLLTYNRYKSFNVLAANKIVSLKNVPASFIKYLNEGINKDLVFAVERIDRDERITQADVLSFAGIELKLNLLFGLRHIYNSYILGTVDKVKFTFESMIAYWLTTEQRGFIMVEELVLANSDLTNADVQQSLTGAIVPVPSNKLLFIFPAFVPVFNDPAFRQRLEYFLSNELPADLSYKCCYPGKDVYLKLIHAFVEWRNGMIFLPEVKADRSKLSQHALNLSYILKQCTVE